MPTESIRKRGRSSSEEISTAACDQCRLRKVRCDRRQPQCSNCRKAGVECNSSSSSKRVNHTKQLRDEFSIVLKHINHVDETLGALTEFTRQIAATVMKPPGAHAAEPLDSQESCSLHVTQDCVITPPQPRTSSRSDSSVELVEFELGGERLYSYPAPIVLVKSLCRQATEALLPIQSQQESQNENISSEAVSHYSTPLQNPAARAAIQLMLDDFPFKQRCEEHVAGNDLKPISAPHRLIVNLSVDGYLRNFNKRTPIFDDADLYQAIDALYSTERQVQENQAWPLIVNAIVLLQLGLEIRAARASHGNTCGMNDSNLPPFLENCDRAIRNLHAFMVPSILNVKALMTLTLVARDFYNNSTAEQVCHAACQLGRAVGLHRSRRNYQKHTNDIFRKNEEERERLFGVLFTLDKQRVFMTGQPCDLYAFDSDYLPSIQHSPSSIDDNVSNLALSHMMIVWEDIYLNLYASKGASATDEIRARHIQRIHNFLDQFGRKNIVQSGNSLPSTTADTTSFHTELKYGYLILQLLLLQCEQDSDEKRMRIAKLARMSLEIILGVSKEPATTLQLALLASLFRDYPAIAFIELTGFHLTHLLVQAKCHSEVKSDIQLLQAVCDQVRLLQFESLAHSFFNKTCMGLSWGLSLLLVVVESLTSSDDQQRVLEHEQYTRDNRGCQSSVSQTYTDPSTPAIPDIWNSCSFDFSQVQRYRFRQASFHSRDQAMDPTRASALADLSLFAPDLVASHLPSSNQYGDSSFSTSLSSTDLNAIATTSGSDFSDFDLSFCIIFLHTLLGWKRKDKIKVSVVVFTTRSSYDVRTHFALLLSNPYELGRD